MSHPTSRLAVVINLDYQNQPSDLCRMLWLLIEKAMIAAGFVLDGRIFVVHNDEQAAERARAVLKALEPSFESLGVSQFEVVREFYSFDLASKVDLHMVESTELIELIELP